MGRLVFNGTTLKDGGRVIANVSGDRVRSGAGATVVCNIRGEQIRAGSGATVVCNVKNDEVREGSGAKRIARLRDVDSAIDGPGKVVKAALWFYFVR